MEPASVTTEMWHGISVMLRFLWLYVFLILGVAVNFLIAHAVIPSLADSGQLPSRIARLRPLFYLGSLGLLVVAVISLFLAIVNAQVLGQIWGRWWI